MLLICSAIVHTEKQQVSQQRINELQAAKYFTPKWCGVIHVAVQAFPSTD